MRVRPSSPLRLVIALQGMIAGAPMAVAAPAAPMDRIAIIPATVSFDTSLQERWIPLAGPASAPPIISILVNGQPVVALVDTGMPTTTVDRSWALRHAIPSQPCKSLGSLGGGVSPTEIGSLVALQIGGMRQSGGAVQIADLSSLSRIAGITIEGIVGADFLARHAVEIDFDNRRIRFRASGAKPPQGERIPLDLRERGGRLLTMLEVGERRFAPVLIDTGDDSSLTITRAAWPDAASSLRLTDIAAVNLAGNIYITEIGRIDGVHLGDQNVDAVPVRFEDKPLDAGDAARIGAALLSRFNVFMDAGRGVMVLSPRLTSPSPAAVSMAGVQGVWTDEGINILHVMRGSPAHDAGLVTGDRICTIDGQNATAAAQKGALGRWSQGPAGKRVVLVLCDGRTLTLILREFY